LLGSLERCPGCALAQVGELMGVEGAAQCLVDLVGKAPEHLATEVRVTCGCLPYSGTWSHARRAPALDHILRSCMRSAGRGIVRECASCAAH
jgi:hypothetical protein